MNGSVFGQPQHLTPLTPLISGVPTLGSGTAVGNIDPLIFAVPVSLLFAVGVSLFSKKPDAAHLAACFPEK